MFISPVGWLLFFFLNCNLLLNSSCNFWAVRLLSPGKYCYKWHSPSASIIAFCALTWFFFFFFCRREFVLWLIKNVGHASVKVCPMFALHLNSLTSACSSIIHSHGFDSGRQVWVCASISLSVCECVCALIKRDGSAREGQSVCGDMDRQWQSRLWGSMDSLHTNEVVLDLRNIEKELSYQQKHS